jgi:hypothetical protein
MWFLHKKVLLSKDNGMGVSNVAFVIQKEKTEHVFLACLFTKVVGISWFLDATVFRRPHGTSTTGLAGGILKD